MLACPEVLSYRLYGYEGGLCGGGAGNSWERGRGDREREIFWPLVAFTTQAQIIEGHGNLSDRWTMLPFSNPLWTGPSIMGEEINSIHQLFVSLGPLMPPCIAQEGLINICGLDLSLLAWHRIKTLLFYFYPNTFRQQLYCQFCHNSDEDYCFWQMLTGGHNNLTK